MVHYSTWKMTKFCAIFEVIIPVLVNCRIYWNILMKKICLILKNTIFYLTYSMMLYVHTTIVKFLPKLCDTFPFVVLLINDTNTFNIRYWDQRYPKKRPSFILKKLPQRYKNTLFLIQICFIAEFSIKMSSFSKLKQHLDKLKDPFCHCHCKINWWTFRGSRYLHRVKKEG